MTEKYLGHRTWSPTPLYFPGYLNTVSSGLQGESLKILERICWKASNKDGRGQLLPWRKTKKKYKILMFSFLNSKSKSDLELLFFIFIFNRQCGDMVTQIQRAQKEMYWKAIFSSNAVHRRASSPSLRPPLMPDSCGFFQRHALHILCVCVHTHS